MRRTAMAAAFLVGLLVLVPTVAAALPRAPLPASAAATAIQVVTPPALVAGVETTLVATLRDTAAGTPIGRANLTFSEKTTFGWLVLGNVTTNAQGEGGVPYEPVYNGTYTIVVSYAGNESYAPTNATLALTVLAASSPPPPGIPTDTLIVFVVIAVVGGVWATYAFVGLQILGIRSVGARPEDEAFESRELRKMEQSEKEPQDASASRKRVPGSANASRAVVYLAVSALILSGVAVALLAMGGVGHTAAYNPSTVNLQVTVVPDFRGAGYDSFVPDELVVHQGDTVKITVFNDDTMDHGFAIDAFGVNQLIPAASQDNATGDITPTITVVTFTATTSGAFTWYCTQPCGLGHTTMTGTLVVFPDD